MSKQASALPFVAQERDGWVIVSPLDVVAMLSESSESDAIEEFMELFMWSSWDEALAAGYRVRKARLVVE
jgi:hypothetical protein